MPPAAVGASLDKLPRLGKAPWASNEHPEITAWLEVNRKAIALFVEGTSRPKYFSPMIPPKTDRGSEGLMNVLLPGTDLCRTMAWALAARAMVYAGHGHPDAAWQDLLACHRLARLMSQGGTTIEFLVGCAIEQSAVFGDLAYLERANPDTKHLEGYIHDLQRLPPFVDLGEKITTAERFMLLDSIMQIDARGIAYLTNGSIDAFKKIPLREDDANGIDWDPALEKVNRWFDRLAAVSQDRDRVSKASALDQLEKEAQQLKQQVDTPGWVAEKIKGAKDTAKGRGEAVADVLIAYMTPAVKKLNEAADRTTQVDRNLILAFALAWYHRDTGRYPASLQELTPKYIDAVPMDIFSGKALIYRPAGNGYLLYSVGANGRDDGGRWFDDQPPGDDPSVRMPRPPVR